MRAEDRAGGQAAGSCAAPSHPSGRPMRADGWAAGGQAAPFGASYNALEAAKLHEVALLL